MSNALMELPDSDQAEKYLTLVTNDAAESFRELQNLLAHGDLEGARQTTQALVLKVDALVEFGQQGTAIISGLVAAVNKAVEQRDEANADLKEMRTEFNLAVAQKISDVFSYESTTDEARVEWLADRIIQNGYEAVAESAHEDLDELLEQALDATEADAIPSEDPLEVESEALSREERMQQAADMLADEPTDQNGWVWKSEADQQ